MKNNDIQTLIQKYFLQRLMSQRNVSPETIKSYRDTFRLYLRHIETRCGVPPAKMSIVHFDADHILGFLAYLDKERGNCSKNINNPPSALHSFAKYLIFELPEYSGLLSRSLKVPFRKDEKRQMEFLTEDEFSALKSACNTDTALGRRDLLMLLLLYNTGVRVSELVGLRMGDIHIGSQHTAVYVRILGKGRKERHVPLWKSTAKYLADYMRDYARGEDCSLFANCTDGDLTRSGVHYRLGRLQEEASKTTPSLAKKNITPHSFRHTTAMRMLQSGADISTIAIWLGHESIITTHKYMEADLEMKRQTLEKMGNPGDSVCHFTPDDSIMAFLDSL
ncbi:MAG: site-specific integrase [Deltaproteobacteria bacterium]|jgi:site-specific recombinase XerD|nr:site-specific integrase [Deltaproteobacteria bacterium]